MALTDKQIRFCEEYLIDLNGTQAAIRAGYSEASAKEIASENLTKPNIQEYIIERKAQIANRLNITQEMVLEGYRRLAFYDGRKFYNPDGSLKQVPDLDEETAFALAGFEVTEEKDYIDGIPRITGFTKKIKMSDRKSALDSICRVLGFNAPDKLAQTDKSGNDVQRPKPYTKEELMEILKVANEQSTTH